MLDYPVYEYGIFDPVLEFYNNHGGWEPSRNSVVVSARQSSLAGGIDSLESINTFLLSLVEILLYACHGSCNPNDNCRIFANILIDIL